MIDVIVVVLVTALYEHRSIIKHDINKMRPVPKTEHYHMTAMLFKIL